MGVVFRYHGGMSANADRLMNELRIKGGHDLYSELDRLQDVGYGKQRWMLTMLFRELVFDGLNTDNVQLRDASMILERSEGWRIHDRTSGDDEEDLGGAINNLVTGSDDGEEER